MEKNNDFDPNFMDNWIKGHTSRVPDDKFEICVVCNKRTNILVDTHIDYRIGYIEGLGQLCHDCYSGGTNKNHIVIPTHVINDTPNDIELGNKVRRMYWQREEYKNHYDSPIN